jgi:hypothetical protein
MYGKEELGQDLFQEIWIYTVSTIPMIIEKKLFVLNLT